jgi:hypothetical protein
MHKVKIHDQEYSVKGLEGSFHLGAIISMIGKEQIFDPEAQKKTATAIRNSIPDLPESIISPDGQIKMLAEDFMELVDEFRIFFFLDNLKLARDRKNYEKEIEFAKGLATVKVQLEVKKKQPVAWEWNDSVVDESPLFSKEELEKKAFVYFKEYIDEQIKLASDVLDNERADKLADIFQSIQASFLKETVPNKKNNQVDALAKANKEIEELKAKLTQQDHG